MENDHGPLPSTSRRRTIIPEDTAIYAVYPDDVTSSTSSSIHSLRLDILTALSPHLQDYIWQHDPFNLAVPSSSATSCPMCGTLAAIPHLHGKSRYGDNVEDEWFIVFLLFEVSRKFPPVSIRVWDTDGEFLLIEAAYLLPRWLNPENSANRVFIRRGELHILDKRVFPLRANPSLPEALRALRTEGVVTRASDAVRGALRRRIAGYPERARTNMHRARVRVPLPVAQVLKHEPRLIALAVEAFYDRDVDSMKHASEMERFLKCGGSGVEIAQVSVRMSRAMYAQLVQQNFQAPRCYPMPSRDVGPLVFREAELGMKIACGFEMMYQDRRGAGEQGKGSAWDVFKESLVRSGYFRDLLAGSQEYRRLMSEAEARFRSSPLFGYNSDILNAPVRCIDEILAAPFSINDFNDEDIPPDDDTWLYDGEDELNLTLKEREKEMEFFDLKHNKNSMNRKEVDTSSGKILNESNIDDMASALRTFVQKISSFEGAEVPNDRELKEVTFDVDRFIDAFKLSGEPTCELRSDDSDTDIEEGSSASEMDFDDVEDEDDSTVAGIDPGDDFMQFYTDALNKELKASTLEKSFIHVQPADSEGLSTTGNMQEDLAPVDVDGNLVKSFLDSYSSQQGLPGPASNLLGTLGLKLPDDKEKDGKR